MWPRCAHRGMTRHVNFIDIKSILAYLPLAMKQRAIKLLPRWCSLFFVLLLGLQTAPAEAEDSRLFYAMYRKPGLTRLQFQQYWRNVHAPLVQKHAAALGISACTHFHAIPAPFNLLVRLWRKTLAAPDGISAWQVDPEALSAALETEAGRQAMDALIEDEATFVDFSRSSIWLAREHQIVEGAPTPEENAVIKKVVWAGHGQPAYTPGEFQYHYLNTIGPVVQEYAAIIGIESYVQAHTIEGPLNAVLPRGPRNSSSLHRAGRIALEFRGCFFARQHAGVPGGPCRDSPARVAVHRLPALVYHDSRGAYCVPRSH